MSNVIYIIYHPAYGEDIYKLGFTTKASGLMQRYRTYYPDDPVIEHTCEVSEPRLAEKLLFHWLRDYRIHKSKEFFHYNLNDLKEVCDRVVQVVDLTDSYI